MHEHKKITWDEMMDHVYDSDGRNPADLSDPLIRQRQASDAAPNGDGNDHHKEDEMRHSKVEYHNGHVIAVCPLGPEWGNGWSLHFDNSLVDGGEPFSTKAYALRRGRKMAKKAWPGSADRDVEINGSAQHAGPWHGQQNS